MKAEFFHPEKPDEVVGVAVWNGRGASIEAADDSVREAIERVFRPSPVAVPDASQRQSGATGETVVAPGDLDWFRVAAIVRAEREGLAVRFVTERAQGWDPAGAYRSMRDWVAEQEAEPS